MRKAHENQHFDIKPFTQDGVSLSADIARLRLQLLAHVAKLRRVLSTVPLEVVLLS